MLSGSLLVRRYPATLQKIEKGNFQNPTSDAETKAVTEERWI